MKKTKNKLGLNRTTIQKMTEAQATDVHGGIQVPSATCTYNSARCHSLFDSCYNTDCCLEKP